MSSYLRPQCLSQELLLLPGNVTPEVGRITLADKKAGANLHF